MSCDSEYQEEDNVCPLCNKDFSNELINNINQCKTCDINIGCGECINGWTIKESNYCEKHEDDYDSDYDLEFDPHDTIMKLESNLKNESILIGCD